ncbi:hypothetical protein DSM104443_00835 [Usitatibacter rugosus]|uniref:DUF192 domain-containing protein n=1 Tax=Usitatibacter rugosus TaxID=2732067 RepID=A0A6M4GRU7_9PROT|nr:DUF192 domain-containing protein [Usitatibacter rugosus]QJR09785.1 hypothetical protein DSM104443_00835 [Usitatibacter rugosus]
MRVLPFDRLAAALVLAALALPTFAQDKAEKLTAPLKTISVKIGAHPLKVEVADNDAARSRGLMFRQAMGKNDGMLFVFADPGYHSMWMMNTYIPLSVAFIDEGGTILNILDMTPKTEDTHTAAGPARYAIETNQGWFAERKLKAGDKVTGLPKS